MAKSELLMDFEENVSCPVCLDVFHDPKRLQCEHSLCTTCIDSLLHNNAITCPICGNKTEKANVKKNLSLQSFVDLFQNSQDPSTSQVVSKKRDFQGKLKDNSSDKPKSLCELCNIYEAEFYCACCRKITCLACKNSHITFTNCASNNIEKIETCSARLIMVLKDKLVKIRKLTVEFEGKLNAHLASKKDQVQQSQQAVDDFEKSSMDEIQQYCTKQRENIEELAAKHENELTEMYTNMIRNLNSCKQKIEQGTSMGDCDIIQQYDSLKQSAVELLKEGDNFTVPQKKICVKISGDKSISYQNYLSTSEVSCQNVLHYASSMWKIFLLDKTIQLSESNGLHWTSLLHRGNDILCFHKSKLYKVDVEKGSLEEEKEISILLPGNATLATYVQSVGLAVVVHKKGLYLFGKRNSALVSFGDYKGIFCRPNQIFALTFHKDSTCILIEVFTCRTPSSSPLLFHKSSKICTTLKSDNRSVHGIVVRNEAVFISHMDSSGEYYIYKLNKTGTVFQRYNFTTRFGRVSNEQMVPWIVGRDDCGGVIIGNAPDGQLVVFDLDLNVKLVQKISMKLRNVSSAVASNNGKLFLVAQEKREDKRDLQTVIAICS